MPFVAAIAGHPAVRGEGATAAAGRDLAHGAAGAAALARGVAVVDRGALPAAIALAVSLGYLSLWLLRRAVPSESPGGTYRPAAAAVVLGVALAGHGTAAVLAMLGAGPAAAIAAGAIVSAAGCAAVPLRFEPGTIERRTSNSRLALAFAAGSLLSAAAVPADLALAAATGTPQFPDAWFPVAVDFCAAGRLPVALGVAAAIAAAALALERARPHVGPATADTALILAPAVVFLLGPASPARGLAAALTAHALLRCGAGPGLRAAALLTPSTILIACAILV